MEGYIGSMSYVNMSAMKYWSYPAKYDPFKKKEEIISMIMSNDYIGALKVDGYYERIVKDEDGNCFMISRGKIMNKIDWVPHLKEWVEKLPNGTCLLCEGYIPGYEGSKNMTRVIACTKEKSLQKQRDYPISKPHLYIFDVWAFSNIELINRNFEDRVKILEQNVIPYAKLSPYVSVAKYYYGEELIQMIEKYLSEGREGAVLTRRDAKAMIGKRTPAKVTVKVKREVSIDCFVIGYNKPEIEYTGDNIENWMYFAKKDTMELLPEGRHYGEENVIPVTRYYYKGIPGSLKMGVFDRPSRKVIHYCDLSGLDEDILANWGAYYMKVIEVGGMDFDSATGNIRHPRFIQFRDDKLASECSLSQVLKRKYKTRSMKENFISEQREIY